MRTAALLLLLPLAVSCGAAPTPTPRTPINGFLQSDLDGNGKSITNAYFAGNGTSLTNVPPSPITVPQAFYLAPRTDGRAGSGTLSDPYDASTPTKLQTTWYSCVYSNMGAAQKKLVFMAGAYFATNSLAVPVGASNISLSGYGATIYLTNSALSDGSMSAFTSDPVGVHGITWEGFDLDCGTYVTMTGNGKTSGITHWGNNSTVRDVTIRNIIAAGSAAYESFGIILDGTNNICRGNVVRNLIASGGTGDVGGTGIVIEGAGSVLAENIVDLMAVNTNGFNAFGYSIYGSDIVMAGNVARNCSIALSMDSTSDFESAVWRDNLVVGNHLSGDEKALRIEASNQHYQNWTLTGNYLKSAYLWVYMTPIAGYGYTNYANGFQFIGNRFGGSVTNVDNIEMYPFNWHTFIANSFSTNVDLKLDTNANLTYGGLNSTNGVSHNAWLGATY